MAGNSGGLPTGLHTPRLDARRKALRSVFSPAAMAKAWKQYVRPGLRDQEILDLFDYNDFHWNQLSLFEHLSQSIVDGRYKPSPSLAARLEKKLGVCRTIVTPTPEDAVVLQCIVESILPTAIKAQPSQNAFFSRSHASFQGEFIFGRDYIWFKKWPIFFKKRISISTTHEWVVTTDISTFFDNVHYGHLRNILSTLDGIDEVILDIMFNVIDEIAWRPDYLPSSRVGLPQVQFDAPRLLSHVYLYEVDQYLKKQTSNTFVRWVDDITFAVDSLEEGKSLLRDLDALLQLRGVRLNSAKTQVLSKKDARAFFQGVENERIDKLKEKIDFALKNNTSITILRNKTRKNFDKFRDISPYGHYDKVIKRYIGLFILLSDDYALSYCLSSINGDPSLRDTVFRYLQNLGPNSKTLKTLENYLRGGHALDDTSLCEIARTLTIWKIVPGTPMFRRLAKLGSELMDTKFVSRSNFYFVAGLWLISKYGNQKRLRDALQSTESIWSNSEFLSRQVAASSAKFRSIPHFRWISLKIERHGFRSAVSVLSSLREIQDFDKVVPPHIRLYILNGRKISTYSVQRFLITFRILLSPKLPSAYKTTLIADLLKYMNDPHYEKILKSL